MKRVELGIGLAPTAIGEAEIGIAKHADEADLGDVERTRLHCLDVVLEARHAGPGAVPVVIGPRLPTQAFRPYDILVAAEQHGIEHALKQRMVALDLPPQVPGSRDQLAATRKLVER